MADCIACGCDVAIIAEIDAMQTVRQSTAVISISLTCLCIYVASGHQLCPSQYDASKYLAGNMHFITPVVCWV